MVTPEEASNYAEHLWRIYSPTLAPILDVNLPPDVEAGFTQFFDGLDLSNVQPIPEWVMDLYAVQNAITAANYHQRRIDEIESVVTETITAALAQLPPLATHSNTAMRTMTLSFEYQAYLFAFRRCFEYLGRGVLGCLGVEPVKYLSEVPTAIAFAQPVYQHLVPRLKQELMAIHRRFRTVLAADSPRNQTAHIRPIEAGAFRFWLEPGSPIRIGLEDGGELLPMRYDATVEGATLACRLEHQLHKLADSVFALLQLLPASGHGLANARLV